MAERRMFTQRIVESDAFTDLPLTAQALYFHLNMSADDDGIVNSPKKIARAINASEDDLDLLIEKRFLLRFSSGVVAIKHWLMHNSIKKDRYKPTEYQEEYSHLYLKQNKAYTDDPNHEDLRGDAATEAEQDMPENTPEPAENPAENALEPERSTNGTRMEPEWNQNGAQMEPQVRLGKDRLGKDRLYSLSTPARAREREQKKPDNEFIPPTLAEVEAYCKERKSPVDPKTFFDYFTASEWIDTRGSPVKNWKQRIIAWEKDEKQKTTKPGMGSVEERKKKYGFTPTEF